MKKLLIVSLVLLSGCAWFRDPPQAGVTTGATVVYNGGAGGEVFSICDRGNLVYLTKSQPAVAIVKDGCNPEVTQSRLAQLAAIQKIADKPDRPQVEPQAQPSPSPIVFPQPFIVQLTPQQVATVAESREPVVVQITPSSACPACPLLQPAEPTMPRMQSSPMKKSQANVVLQLDPNTASVDDLERLPGVTGKTAQAIVKNRPYLTTHQLVEKRVLTEADLKAMAPYLVIR